MAVSRASKLVTALVVAAVMAAGAAFAADTASADHHLIRNYANQGCLRTDGNGKVSLLPCRDADRSQHWQSWNGGWIKSVATGFCLHTYLPAPFDFGVRATPQCNPNEPTQWWTYTPLYSGAEWGTISQNVPTMGNTLGGVYCLGVSPASSSVVDIFSCNKSDGGRQWRKFPLPH